MLGTPPMIHINRGTMILARDRFCVWGDEAERRNRLLLPHLEFQPQFRPRFQPNFASSFRR
jgi:hypothetical protein